MAKCHTQHVLDPFATQSDAAFAELGKHPDHGLLGADELGGNGFGVLGRVGRHVVNAVPDLHEIAAVVVVVPVGGSWWGIPMCGRGSIAELELLRNGISRATEKGWAGLVHSEGVGGRWATSYKGRGGRGCSMQCWT